MIHYLTSCLALSIILLLLALPLAAQQWEPANNGLDAGRVHRFGFSAEGDIYASAQNGIYQLVGGNRWEMLHQNFRAFSFLTGPDGTMIMSGISTTHFIQALYRSTDNGQSWQLCFDTVHADPQISPDGTLYFLDQKGLSRSSDMGSSWDLLETPEASPIREYDPGVLVTEESGALIFAPGDSSVYVSTDKGSSWSRTGAAPVNSIRYLEILPDARLAVPGNGVDYVSSDRGRSWQAEDSLMLGPKQKLPSGNYVFYNPGRLAGGLFASVDSGRSWNRIDRELLLALDVAPDGTLWRSIAPDVYRSVDEGRSWEEVTVGMEDIGATPLVVDSDGTLYTTRLDTMLTNVDPTGPDRSYALFRSSDKGSSWQQVSDSMQQNVEIDDSGRLYGARILPEDQVAGERLRMTHVVSRDGGQSWKRLYDSSLYTVNVYRDGVIIGTERVMPGYDLRMVISLDAGTTWRRVSHPFYVRDFHRTVGGTIIAYLRDWRIQDSSQGIYKSLDNGATWEPIIRGVEMDNIFFSSDTQGTIYFAANPDFSRDVGRVKSIYRLLDNGAAFERILDSTDHSHESAIVLPTAHGTLFLTGASKNIAEPLLRSYDRGATWSAVSFPATGKPMRLLAPVTGKDRAIYSVDKGYYFNTDTAILYRSLDDGQSWHTFNDGLPTSAIGDLLDMPNGPLFIAMHRGIYRISTPSAVSVTAAEGGISFDVVPNPVAGDHASVIVTLESPQHLRVTLHDMLGRTLGVLADEEREAGQVTLPIRAKPAAGSYIVRMSMGEKTTSRVVFFR